MIAQAINELFGYVRSIPALATTTGLTIGGKAPDPGLTKIPLPAAWLVHEGGQNTQNIGASNVPMNITTRLQFAVILYVPYASQTDMIGNQLPLLELLIATVHGQTSSVTGQRWYYGKHRVAVLNTDRIAYHISFVLDAAMS